MRHIIFLLTAFLVLTPSAKAEETASGTSHAPAMRELLASMPDSIFPLLTRNNRLDCIDFIENGMPAKVKNKMDVWSELKVLTADYLMFRLTQHSQAEMKLVNDTTICMVRTYMGPAEDSAVSFYNLKWEPLESPLAQRPAVKAFLKEGLDAEVQGWLEALPLMKASLSAEGNTLTWELQTTELTKEQKKAAEGYLQPVSLMLK